MGGTCLVEGGAGSTCEKSTGGIDVSVSGCCAVELHNIFGLRLINKNIISRIGRCSTLIIHSTDIRWVSDI